MEELSTVDEVSPPPNRLDTKSDESPSVEATVESALSREELLAVVEAEGVTILFSPDSISVQMSVSSEDCIELVDPLSEAPRLALVEALVELELPPRKLPIHYWKTSYCYSVVWK